MSDELDRRGFWRAVLRGALPGKKQPEEQVPLPATEAGAAVVLRPPGARAEPVFVERCVPGCRLCVDACPVYTIVPSYGAQQPGGGDGRPYLLPEQSACVLCGLCMHACPTGALRSTPADQVRVGLAVLREEACIRHRGEPCSVCLERCPFPGAAITEGTVYPEIHGSHCTGCGLCAEACPPHAIAVTTRT